MEADTHIHGLKIEKPERDDLLRLCAAEQGVVAVCGAGGKKTLIEALARRHQGPVGIVCTARMPSPGEPEWRLIAGPTPFVYDRLEGIEPGAPVVLAGLYKPGVLGGLPAEDVPEIMTRGRFRVLYLKADGARHRLIKAPAEGEPIFPPHMDTVLYVVSAHAFGRPLAEETAHHPERLGERIGLALGEPIDVQPVVRLLTSPQGALKGVGNARLIIVINRVDTPEREAMSREIARQALAHERKIQRVILAGDGKDLPVVAVCER